jgi:uncharacterized protein (TIGR02996 family)
MLVIDVREGRDAKRRLSFSRHTLALGRSLPTLTLGRSPTVDVQLAAGEVHDQHAQLVESEGKLDVVPLVHKEDETLLNGDAIHRPTSIVIGGVVGLGDCAITIVAFTPIVPPDFEVVEGDFVKPLRADSSDVGMRLVYADMLEEKGWLVRAEFLRVQVRLLLDEAIDGDREARDRLFRKLGPARLWRQAIGAPSLAQKCPLHAGRECPVRWGTASRASTCGKCGRAVAFATA